MRVTLRTLPIQHVGGEQTGTPKSVTVDVESLQRELEAHIEGEVRFGAGDRGMYSRDASNYRMPPIGIVVPRTARDVQIAVALARRHNAPLISRGGGTSLPGQAVNEALMIDFSKYLNRVVGIDSDARLGIVEPGCILDDLRNEARKHGLTFGPDPATHNRNTLGGMIGNNSCGVHSVLAGRTADNVERLEILLYNGMKMIVGRTTEEELDAIIRRRDRRAEIYRRLRDLRNKYADLIRQRYPQIPRRVSGYCLDELLPEKGFNVARALVGSEGTCVTVLRAWCHLIPDPKAKTLVILGFQDAGAAGDYVPEVLKHAPIACEGFDEMLVEDLKKQNMHPHDIQLLPRGKAWLMVEFGGNDKSDADRQAKRMIEALSGAVPHRLLANPDFEADLWELREGALGATARVPGEHSTWPGWEDSAVPVDRVGDYLRDLKKLMSDFGLRGSLYGHFGDGCIHTRISFELRTQTGLEQYRHFVEQAADMVVRYGGSLSGEHGDGQARGELLERMYGPELIEAFAEFKQIWDPDWKMNPGRIVAPYKLDENLSLGTDFNPPLVETYFQYPTDNGSFGAATNRCVGAGICRRTHEGTMCPSFMATREEKNSTRGRARLLFEMMEGDPVKGGWKNEAVKEALDLCLACKGCKGECPVQVDMATYKAEFLSHYYEGRLRPRSAYIFGKIQVWARLAAMAPGFVNLLSHAPVFGKLAKKIAGVAPQRALPKFAPTTFRSWWRSRPKRHGNPTVILWADTFNNNFHPTTAQAAVEVLEHAGHIVAVPAAELCCGRPLYDYGFLPEAKAYLRRILSVLREPIRQGLPIVVLEPSCCSVFRDELGNLFPNDEDAKRLAQQTFLLSEFLQNNGYKPPRLKGKATLHRHCHEKAVLKHDHERQLLSDMGLEVDEPDSGCCGMAGAFGFEAGEHFDVSMKCGERVLLPEVRRVEPETLVVADGFSCREQIKQTTDREAMHLAQVLQMAIREGQDAAKGPLAEERYVRAPRSVKDDLRTAALVGLCLFGAYKVVRWAVGGARSRES